MEGIPKEGTFGIIDPLTLLANLWSKGFEGAIKVEEGEEHRIFYVMEGSIRAFISNAPGEKLDEHLLAEGKISKEHIRQALEEAGSIQDLGVHLVRLGYLSLEDLREAHHKRVLKALRLLIDKPASIYSLVDRVKPPIKDLFDFPLPHVLSTFFAHLDHRDYILLLIGNLDKKLFFQHQLRDRLQALDLGEDVEEVVRKLDGSHTIMEIITQSEWNELDVLRLLALLQVCGLISEKPVRPLPQKESPLEQKPPEKITPPIQIPEEPQEEVGMAPVAPPPPEAPQELEGSSPPLHPPPVPEVIKTGHHRRKEKMRKYFVIYPLIALGVVLLGGVGTYLYLSLQQKKTAPTIMEIPQKQPWQERKPSLQKPVEATPEKKETPEKPASLEKKAPPKKETMKISEKPPPQKEEPLSTLLLKVDRTLSWQEQAKRFFDIVQGLPTSHSTIQLMLACEKETLEKLYQLQGARENLWLLPYLFRGRRCFKVFWGLYPQKDQAQKAYQSLPGILRQEPSPPQVVTLQTALRHVSP